MRLEVLGRLEGGAKRWTNEIIAKKRPSILQLATSLLGFGDSQLFWVLPPPKRRRVSSGTSPELTGLPPKLLSGTGRTASRGL